MVRKLLLGAAAIFALGGVAHSQIVVLGSSMGKDCYLAVVSNPMPSLAHERVCTEAIASGTLQGRDLTATFINRGIIRTRMNKIDSALSDYETAKNRRPNMGAIYLNEGAALITMGDSAGAIEVLEKSLDLDTQDPHFAHFNLGLAHEMAGDPTAAYYSFTRASELEPDWERPREELERFTVVRNDS
ncbi:MAG: tetratricopeptide repeat protein [Pseudomonadota bacterium]